MMDVFSKYQSIKEVYETMSIYKSVIVYSDRESFMSLYDMLESNDYPISMDVNPNIDIRLYCFDKNDLHMYGDIDWNTVNIIFAIDDDAFDATKELLTNMKVEEYILIVKI